MPPGKISKEMPSRFPEKPPFQYRIKLASSLVLFILLWYERILEIIQSRDAIPLRIPLFHLLGGWGSHPIPSLVISPCSYIQNNETSRNSSNLYKTVTLYGLSITNPYSRFAFCMIELHSHFMKRHFRSLDGVFAFQTACLRFKLHVCVLNSKNEI